MSKLPSAFAKQLKPLREGPRHGPNPRKRIDEALRLARQQIEKGEFRQAERLCVSVLAQEPGNFQALLLGGTIARNFGDRELAKTLFTRAVESAPRSAEAHASLADIYEIAHDYENAARHYERALAVAPNIPHALRAMGRVYIKAGKAEAALAFFEGPAKRISDEPTIRVDRATALITLGFMEQAASLLRENIARGILVGRSYRSLADIKKFSGQPEELGEILDRLKDQDLPTKERRDLHYAAGKICNDIGLYEEAVDHYQASKAELDKPFDIDAFRQRVDTLTSAFNSRTLASKSEMGDPSEVPVFVLGMPRSGTTLVEQISASHPSVFGAGEISRLGTVLSLAGYSHRPNGSILKPPQSLTAPEAKKMAAEYLDYIRPMSASATRIINKTPHNFQYVGMIALLFPNARIIHCTRDPIDNCLSCFFNSFNESHGYNTDLRTLGLYYREYHRLMQHWKALLPGRIYECNYETVIADQEAETRRLIDFLGLPWDDACLRFYETDRTVTTPSRWQVRQPIYKTSVKRWKKYGDKIKPLVDALGDLADTD